MASADLLTRIRAELDARLRELRPLLSEYERLLAAEAALETSGETAPSAPRGRRPSTPAPRVSTPTSAAPVRRRGRPPGRSPGRPRSPTAGTPERALTSERAPKAKRAQRGAAAAAIVAALEHGSHTVSELGVVTALSGPIIHNNLRRLQHAGAITRTKRPGDGKAAYALTSTPA
jgi:hypothetical protein